MTRLLKFLAFLGIFFGTLSLSTVHTVLPLLAGEPVPFGEIAKDIFCIALGFLLIGHYAKKGK